MGSLFKKKLFLAANSVSWSPRLLQRLQQTNCAAATSNTENYRLTNKVTPVFKHASKYGDRTALRDRHGDYSYRGLFLSSRQFAGDLTEILGGSQQERVAFLMPNDAAYVIVQWACWMSGQIAVPLSAQHPPSTLDYFIKDSDARVIVTTNEHLPIVEPLVANSNRRLLVLDDALRVLAMKFDAKLAKKETTLESDLHDSMNAGVKGDFYNNSIAMLAYTSGTTNKPKGVVISHKNIQAQVGSMIDAWKWTGQDIVLHTLPLNHIHGIVNVLLCPMYVGARCVMLPKFESSSVWSELLAVNLPKTERINIYMAVPTIYMKLIQEYDLLFSKNKKMKEYIHQVLSTKMRLMVSGSASLPTPVLNRWEEITGHRLLERYGMTETGMILSNPLDGERVPGAVGTPMPGVEVRISNENNDFLVQGNSKGTEILVKDSSDPLNGELQVKGDSVFKKYWNKPEETAKEFTKDGWFKTGDTVQYDNKVYKILGRSSVDIIKTGGYKVSALEVETAILGHPDVGDCAVVGLPDDTWGQKVVAVVVVKEGRELILSQVRDFTKKLLPKYAVPTILKVVDKVPKNSLGKINKPLILKVLFPEGNA